MRNKLKFGKQLILWWLTENDYFINKCGCNLNCGNIRKLKLQKQ